MGALSKWLKPDGDFAYAVVAERVYRTPWELIPKHVRDGICFTLSCAWIEQKSRGVSSPPLTHQYMEERFETFANLHSCGLTIRKNPLRAGKFVQDLLLGIFSLRLSTRDIQNPEVLTIDKRHDNPWSDFKAPEGDIWKALLSWLEDGKLREKFAAPRDLGYIILELKPKDKGGHAVCFDFTESQKHVVAWDMNEGEYDIPKNSLADFLSALQLEYANECPADQLDIFPIFGLG